MKDIHAGKDLLNATLSSYLEESSVTIGSIADHINVIQRMSVGIHQSQLAGGKLLICGNGGSCADAEHFAGEMTCTFKDRKRRAFSAISLSDNASAITAWTNDFGFNSYFSRQVEALGRAGDILFLITTGGGDRASGASMNMVDAAERAIDLGLKIYTIAGKTGGELSKMSHEFIKVPSFTTSHIQEAHITIIHAICLSLDELELNNQEHGN
jgi:D-sedoheptulose 7-phosphate isomerase